MLDRLTLILIGGVRKSGVGEGGGGCGGGLTKDMKDKREAESETKREREANRQTDRLKRTRESVSPPPVLVHPPSPPLPPSGKGRY